MSAESDEEFREFMRGRWAATVRLAYGLTGDTGHAEDVAQDAFARAYASWGRRWTGGPPMTPRAGRCPWASSERAGTLGARGRAVRHWARRVRPSSAGLMAGIPGRKRKADR